MSEDARQAIANITDDCRRRVEAMKPRVKSADAVIRRIGRLPNKPPAVPVPTGVPNLKFPFTYTIRRACTFVLVAFSDGASRNHRILVGPMFGLGGPSTLFEVLIAAEEVGAIKVVDYHRIVRTVLVGHKFSRGKERSRVFGWSIEP